MGSRWGPKRSRSNSPMPSSSTAVRFPYPDEPDFELVETVEWGPEDASPLDELAPSQKPDRSDDPCGCTRPMDPNVSACSDLSCVLFACQEECRSNCEAGDQCANKRIQKRQWKELEVFAAGKKGKGLKVMEDCKKGDFLTEYVGRAVNKAYLPRLFRRYTNERKLYIMALDRDTYLDARHKGGVARYINHSCAPNCLVERWKVRGILRAAVIALEDIPAGMELSFDYQWERKRGRAPTKCHCGAPTCRGTLEVPRSMEEEALERKLSSHWKKPLIQRAGKEIVNRCIRLFSKETQEYFAADVTSYDETTGKHLVMYRHDLEEVWEDLKQEDWMILDEEAEQFIIRKKAPASMGRSLLTGHEPSIPTPNLLLQGQRTQNYIFVQTPIKEAMVSKHLIERCQRSCRVTITPQQLAKPPLEPDQNDPEEVDKYRALEESMDGTVWKLTIVGSDVGKAHSILEKNVAYLEKEYGAALDSAPPGPTSNAVQKPTGEPPTEVVLPRSIIESVKRRLPMLRDKCRSVNITFVPSESKSKQFSKLMIEGTLQSDVQSAKEHLWKQLNVACEENKAPMTPSGVYKDLGFLGGELNSSDFHRLLEYGKTSPTVMASKSQDAKEDLTRWSPFFASFEATQRCTIWIQSDSDKGRINGANRIVNEASPNAPRKIYFGCDPKVVPKLWNLVKQRASQVARGVKYLYLGPDRLYQPMMMRKGGQFFEFVQQVTGAAVTVDSMTGDHLRIDGKGTASNVMVDKELPPNISEGERAALAEELVRLQIELYRDHSIRHQNWIFGRDWTLARRSCTQSNATTDSSSNSPPNNRTTVSSRTTLSFDSKTLANACLEIADIMSSLGLEGTIAGHASVILYRFATILSQRDAAETQFKIREILLACVFIANKSQKAIKWKRLDSVLEAAYKIFYPGVSFDSSKEEVLVWEEKVIAAESEILESLDYDVFWRGFDWIISAAIEAGKIDKRLAKDALAFSVSGPVLAAGPDLWLTYGEEYVFAAAAGFLDAKLESLFPALSLIPFKVHQAAEMITESMKIPGFGKVQSPHRLFKDGKKGLIKRLPRIKEICAQSMSSFGVGNQINEMSDTQQRYRLMGESTKTRRIFPCVDSAIIKDFVLPALDGICAESKCSIFIENSSDGASQNIVLEGSWRALSIASYLLEQAVSGRCRLDAVTKGPADYDSLSNIQAKGQPGLLQMKKIETVDDAWAGTIQSEVSNQSFWGRKTGGKCCVPGKIKESDLRQAGLRWWIPPRYGPSPTGSICDSFLVNNNKSGTLGALASLTRAFQGESTAFSALTSMMTEQSSSNGTLDRFVAVSLQRWPSEKVAKREQGKDKKEEKSKEKKSKGRTMQIGFSAGALQEMQLLNQAHGLIKSPQGHPNFILPISVALPSEIESGEMNFPSGGSNTLDLRRIDEDIFSLTRSSLENEAAAQKERKRKDMVTGPHLVFPPSPFVLQRFVSRKKKRESDTEDNFISPAIFAAWAHDLLSALLHCHSNDIILRNFQSDQIVVDHSGVVKISGFYRATVLSPEDKNVDIVEKMKSQSRKGKPDDDDILSNTYAPPEMLLGSQKFTKETDIWTVGSLLAHLLLGRPIYSGKDRQSLLSGMYKMIGTPAKENFPQAVKFPHYKKPTKKYRPGVAKALQYMMKEEENQKHADAIDLISQMLQLDPKNRISAVGALQHPFLSNYMESSNSEAFQQEYVRDWMSLKKKLMRSSKTEEDETKERERGIKRKAMLMAASKTMDNEADDLYDMDDILGDENAAKVPKV
jgi:hypothetical protein